MSGSAVSSGPEVLLVSGSRAAASSPSESVLERSDEIASRRLGQEPLKKDENDPLADMPFCLDDFTEILNLTGLLDFKEKSERQICTHPHTILRNQIQNILRKWQPNRLSERPKLRYLLEPTKNNKGSLQKTHWRCGTSSREDWWLDNNRSKSSR